MVEGGVFLSMSLSDSSGSFRVSVRMGSPEAEKKPRSTKMTNTASTPMATTADGAKMYNHMVGEHELLPISL